MARLLTDSKLREAFREDGESVADRIDLRDNDRAAFVSLEPDQLEQQAIGLVNKRREEVARLIPVTWQRLGPSSSALFRAFAESFWPESHRRHAEDAVAFADFLNDKSVDVLYQPELNWQRFQLANRRLQVCWVRDYLINEKPHRAIQLMYRWRERTYLRFLL